MEKKDRNLNIIVTGDLYWKLLEVKKAYDLKTWAQVLETLYMIYKGMRVR